MIKGKFECPFSQTFDVLEGIRQAYANEKIDTADGIKVIWHDKWVHIRSSNTEPIIRVIVEAKTKKEGSDLYSEISKKINEFIGKKR